MPFSFKELQADWTKVYNPASTSFNKDFQAATKADREMGGAAGSILEPAKKGTAPLVQCLDRLGKVRDFTGLNEKDLKAALAAAAKEIKQLAAEAKKYTTILDATINGEIKWGYGQKAKVKDRLPESYRQLKILKTTLAAIQARAEREVKAFATQKEIKKIGDKQTKDMAKARKAGDDAKEKAIQAEAGLKKLLVTLSANYKSAMMKGAAVIQKIKASPDVATYNKEMFNGGRDIRQNIL